MFDIGWTELLLLGVIALIVVGPKDLPSMFRTLGRATARMRGMAREFQRAMDQAADESGVKDVASDLKVATSAKRLGFDKLQETARSFQEGFKEQPKSLRATDGAARNENAPNKAVGGDKAASEVAESVESVVDAPISQETVDQPETVNSETSTPKDALK